MYICIFIYYVFHFIMTYSCSSWFSSLFSYFSSFIHACMQASIHPSIRPCVHESMHPVSQSVSQWVIHSCIHTDTCLIIWIKRICRCVLSGVDNKVVCWIWGVVKLFATVSSQGSDVWAFPRNHISFLFPVTAWFQPGVLFLHSSQIPKPKSKTKTLNRTKVL